MPHDTLHLSVEHAPPRTYGEVRYSKKVDAWFIKCEPQISIVLKRVFAKIGVDSHGVHRLSNSNENARDLEWFLLRHPLVIADEDRALLTAGADTHREREQWVADLIGGYVPIREIEMAEPAREYQAFASTMHLHTGSQLLVDDVGLGKTVTAICSLTDPRTLPAVVVVESHLTGQWRDQINRFLPKLRVHVTKTVQPYPIKEHPDVFVTTYHKLVGWAGTFAKSCKSIVFDEVQQVRHRGTHKYNAAAHVAHSVPFKQGLSATPIFNYGGEFFNVFEVLSPGVLGTEAEFLNEWCETGRAGEKAKVKDTVAFGRHLRDMGLMLRRTRADVGRELPPLSKFVQWVAADLKALNQVSASCAELAQVILRQGETFRGQKLRASQEFDAKMRQATGIAKAPHVAAFVRLLAEEGQKVLLFGWHREVYRIWNELLADLNPVMFTGSESPAQKAASKKAFIEGDAQVMIMSLRAGSGTDGLQHVCSTVVIGELDWAHGVMVQDIGRVDRDGQPNPVMAFFMVSDEGIDPFMAEVAGVKRQQLEGVTDLRENIVEELQTDSDRVRKAAEYYLRKHNLPIPKREDEEGDG